MVSDRSTEFNEIIDKLRHNNETTTTLRQRNNKKQEMAENESVNQVYDFSKTFLNECTMTNGTLVQLSKKLKEISQKSEHQFNFSFSGKAAVDPTKEIDEALNICSMNISIMAKRLEDFKALKMEKSEKLSMFSKLFQSSTVSITSDPVLEHCRLVLLFLEGRVGRITEDLEAHKSRKKNREKLLYTNDNKPINKSPTYQRTTVLSESDSNSAALSDPNMAMLQVENSQMLEEMSRGLFETLSSTETQILEISRLQATLQNHLSMQHDLTCRLFEDSVTTVEDTRKGNEYLKRSGKESYTMRRFLVTLILGMSVLLLLLHYFNK